MTDELYVVHSFEKHFAKFKNKKIVIYGKGPKTKILTEVFPDYNIVGLMDPGVMDGYYHGKPMLNYEEIQSLKVDIIIVVGQIATVHVVHDRISKFCMDNHIDLYGINGKNLFEYFGTGIIAPLENEYFFISEKDLKKCIDRYETISFDVFDTLIMRRTLNPLDVFEIIQDKAKRQGIIIEEYKALRRKAELENPNKEVNIYEIYEEFQKLTGISQDTKQKLLELEIETERQMLVARDKMVEIFRYALEQGKKVYLISDMYLPGSVLEGFLQGLKIMGYEKLFVSCDCRQAKWNTLFDLFKGEIKGKCLHIGDNDYVDGQCAKEHGLDSFLIKSAYSLLESSTYGSILPYLKTANERSLVGLCISKVFNNPFALYHSSGRPEVERVEDLGFLFAGPLLSCFTLWLVSQMKSGHYDELLLSSRDGYIIQKLYGLALDKLGLKEIPKGIYFETSRRACATAAMETENDIDWLAKVKCSYSVEQMMQDRFALSKDVILPYSESKYENIVEYVMEHKEEIYKSSKHMRENFWKYMDNIGLKMGRKYALMDFCAVGTSQYFLEKFCPFEVEGLYLCRYHSDYNMVNSVEAKGMFDNPALYATESYFYEHYLFMETIMTSFVPSLAGFDENGNPVYAKEERSEIQLQYVHDMHEAIEMYFNEYVSYLYIEEQEISAEIADKIYNWMAAGYTNEHCSVLNELLLVDGLGIGQMNFKR